MELFNKDKKEERSSIRIGVNMLRENMDYGASTNMALVCRESTRVFSFFSSSQ